MEKLFAGPLGLVIVLAQAAFFFYLLRGMFTSTGDEPMNSTFRAGRKRGRPRGQRPHRPDAANEGARGWSRISPILETFHDLDRGAMTGCVTQGSFAGRRLEDLSRADCLRLFEYCHDAGDDYAASFLTMYMNYRFGGGFTGASAGAGFGGPRQQQQENAFKGRARAEKPDDGGMSREKAYEALGLALGASDEDVHKAHRALIKKYHPDLGGTHAQAARINQAKDLLLAKAQ